MIIVFCNQCGQRIAQAEIDRRKCESLTESDPLICEACSQAKIAVSSMIQGNLRTVLTVDLLLIGVVGAGLCSRCISCERKHKSHAHADVQEGPLRLF